jgi:Tfp pilus assembly protein PilF
VVTGYKGRSWRRFKVKLAAQTIIGGVLLVAAVRTYQPDWPHRIEGAVGVVMLLDVPYECWLSFTAHGAKRMDAKVLRLYRSTGTFEGFEDVLGLLSPPKRARLINRLGAVFETNGDLDQAETAFRRAAELGNPAGMANVARMHGRRGEEGPALLWYQRAFAHGLDVPHTLGDLLHSQGQSAAAIDAYRRAVKAGHKDRRAILGDLLINHGAQDHVGDAARDAAQAEGEAILRAAVADGDPIAMNLLGVHLQKQGRPAAAEALFEKAAAQEEPYALVNLAKIRLGRQARDQAEVLLRRALNAGHTNQAILAATLADLAAQRHDEATAEQMYRRAIDAGSATAEAKLADMLRRRSELHAADVATPGTDPLASSPPAFDVEDGG